MSDDHIAITGLALCALWVATAYGRRYFRKPPPVAPLRPEVRPELLPCAARCSPLPFFCTLGIGHPGEHVAHGTGYRVIHGWADELDPVAAVWDAWAAQCRADTKELRSELNDPTAVARWMEGAS